MTLEAIEQYRRGVPGAERILATKLATLGKGKPSDDNTQICVFTQKQAAEMLQVSPRSVQHARTVLDHGSQELIEAVERGVGRIRKGKGEGTTTDPKRKSAWSTQPRKCFLS